MLSLIQKTRTLKTNGNSAKKNPIVLSAIGAGVLALGIVLFKIYFLAIVLTFKESQFYRLILVQMTKQ